MKPNKEICKKCKHRNIPYTAGIDDYCQIKVKERIYLFHKQNGVEPDFRFKLGAQKYAQLDNMEIPEACPYILEHTLA